MARLNRARWICQVNAQFCDGFFYVYGEKRPCPLKEKCHGYDRQLEYFWPQKDKRQRTLKIFTPGHRKKHHDRLWALTVAFGAEKKTPEQIARRQEYMRFYHQNHKKQQTIDEQTKAKPSVEIPPPPCGGDCANCPYDDDCHYPDWDEQYLAQRKARMEKARMDRSHAKEAERMRTDPEFRAKRNAYKAQWAREHRSENERRKAAADPGYAARKKEDQHRRHVKWKAKKKWIAAGGTPDAFEAAWAALGGDCEAFKAAWKKAGKSPEKFKEQEGIT